MSVKRSADIITEAAKNHVPVTPTPIVATNYDPLAYVGGVWGVVAIITAVVLLILAVFAPWFIYRIKTNSDDMLKLMKKIVKRMEEE